MNKLKLASGVLLVFLVGVLAGSLGTGYYYQKRVAKFEAGGPPVQERIQIILGRFSNELDLTDEQRTEFEKIVKESQEKIVALGNKFQPEIKQINDDTFTSIKNKLTDEQKAKLETLIKRMEDVHDRFPSGQRQQQRTPDQSRPQQQGGLEQGPRQTAPDQTPPQGTPGKGSLTTPDSVMPRGGAPDGIPSQRSYMRIAGDLKDRLILSQEQEEKLRDILEKFSKDQQEVFEKYNQEKQDSAVLKNALLETEKSFEKGLSNILTKEQMEAYRKAKDSGAIKLSPRGMP
jgi:uncharacterized membrane protein